MFIKSRIALTLSASMLLIPFPVPASGQESPVLGKLIFEPVLFSELPESPEETDNPDDGENGDTQTILADIERYRDEIADLEINGGAYAPELVEPLEALGRLQQQVNNHDNAIGIFVQAMQVIRANNGLFDPAQIPLIAYIVRSLEAQGKLEEMLNHQEHIYYLTRKNNAGNDELLHQGAMTWAAQNVRNFLKSVNQSDTSPLTLAMPLAFNQMQLNNSIFTDSRLNTARNIYNSRIEIFEATNAEDQAEAAYQNELNRARRLLAGISYLALKQKVQQYGVLANDDEFSYSWGLYGQSGRRLTNLYIDGLRSLENVEEALRQSTTDSTLRDLAQALIDIADYRLYFSDRDIGSRNQAGLAYAEAWDILLQAGLSESEAEDLMFPGPALMVPVLAGQQFSRQLQDIPPDAELEYRGYVDIQFTQSRYGEPRNLRVLDSSPGTNDAVSDTLLEFIRLQTFRPQIVNGEMTQAGRVQLRVFYTW